MKQWARRRHAILAAIWLALLQTASNAQSGATLDLAKIMQGAKWMGALPDHPYWSEDSRTLYFSWNPENQAADSLYQVARTGGRPVKVSLARQKELPQSGRYNRSLTRKVFERDGDIFLFDLKNGKSRQITNTLAQERDPCFSFGEDSVLFTRENNLFAWNQRTGLLAQVTDFRTGHKPAPDKAGTPEQQFLAAEELGLMQVLRKRESAEENRKRLNKLLATPRPRAIYIGKASVENIQLSPDSKFVTFRLQDDPGGAQIAKVPNYVTQSGFTQEIATREKVGAPQPTYHLGYWELAADTVRYVNADSLPEIFAVREWTRSAPVPDSAQSARRGSDSLRANAATPALARDVIWHGPFWSDNGKRAFVVVLSLDNKDRWLALWNPVTGKLTAMHHRYDPAWIGGPSIVGWWSAGEVGWMPDNESVWFCSEESGYSHLYTVNVRTLEQRALTSGKFEIYSPFLSRDKKHWYFTSNEGNPGEYHFYTMPLTGGTRTRLTNLPGEDEVTLAPDETVLAIRHSQAHEPWEIYVQANTPGAPAQRVTFSTTAEFQQYPWRRPEFVTYAAPDGQTVHARLYRPEKPNGAGVIFVHGAGYLQNAHNGWSFYFREYMFHNLLVDLGYTVLDPDYRASAGYGRDWRTAIYRHMGGKDLDDVVAGAEFLVHVHGVEARRMGIYGGSYGGFITLMAMFTKPGVFAAGAALRPVTDWAHYNHGYTSNILNIPQADTVAYRRSSPIYFAEGLHGALLICHGMVDRNVHFQDTVRLAQRLIELGKERWEVALYPMEDHAFEEASSWRDEYARIFHLFETNLR